MDKYNKDRGTIKWTSLMLPEHVQMVKSLWKEDERVEKGILDEQKAVEIDFLLQRAVNDNLTISIKHHDGFDYRTTLGKVDSVCMTQKRLHGLQVDSKEVFSLSLHDIVDITIV
ncbi:YolD-like family protein [Thalassobacillus hwangdonensis]|uniref:YolD-like family protein n=1 Tax=Thalassobacillus hwangdonensis TaxID=546108 RepID=A0ABW3KZU1_9BACI